MNQFPTVVGGYYKFEQNWKYEEWDDLSGATEYSYTLSFKKVKNTELLHLHPPLIFSFAFENLPLRLYKRAEARNLSHQLYFSTIYRNIRKSYYV